jgi:hypothetical protein
MSEQEVFQALLTSFDRNDENGTGKIEFGAEFDSVMQDV